MNEEEIIEQINISNIESVWAKTSLWLGEHVLTYNALYQGAIIAAAILFSFIILKLTRTPIRKKIESSKLSMTYKRRAYHMQKLMLPAITLMAIVVIKHIAALDIVGMDVWLLTGVMKALMAWIVIRIMVEFIDNSIVRNILAITIWVIAALSIFGIINETATFLNDIGFDFGETRISVLVIFKGAFYLLVLVYFATFLSSIAEQRISKSKKLTRASKLLIGKILRIILIGIAVIMGLITAGLDLSLFAVLGGAIGLGIGLGLQRGVSNLFSGMMLLFDRSIQPGDVLELENGTFGWVEKMGGRYTEIITGSNKSYMIPNEELVTQRVVNWSHGDTTIRVSIEFGVHYKSDPHKVIEVAKEAAKKPERVLTEPEPTCWITRFGENSIDFSLGFMINDPRNGLINIKGEVFLALWDAFKEHGIEIPYPHREVYIHQVDTAPAP